jgi:hypothetical protein
LQILGAKNYRPQHTKVIGQFTNGPCVQRQVALPGRPVNLYFMLALSSDLPANKIALLLMPDHLGAAYTAKGTQGCDQVNCFKDIGLALRVITEKQVKAGRKSGIQPRVIAEVS